MDEEEERYEGERRGLRSFLGDIGPAVELRLGHRSMLAHAISRALRSDALAHYRHAREIFNRLPRNERLALSKAMMVTPTEGVPQGKDAHNTMALCIESAHPTDAGEAWRVELRDGGIDLATVQVRVRLGTLPSTAARSLREIADLIEENRSILSNRQRRLRGADDEIDAEVG